MEENFTNIELDKIDRKILKLLQADGRMSNAEVAENVNVSPATCHRRTQRLFDEGIISRVTAQVRPDVVDLSVLVLVGAVLERSTPESFAEFEAAVPKFPFVLECQCVAGDFDYFLKVRVKDISDFNNLHRAQLLTLPGVRQLRSFFVLKEVIENAPLEF
ncbi:MAG: Lrp/AsnC family transcriptional regulator [Hyphomicrobiales bacterium]|nr:Lrp/AsnC family transcriptional regulator [Hyphomicrobiales bacterium]